MTRALTLALASATLIGCMTMGRRFDIRNVNELTPGRSTLADATALLGPPSAESDMGDGTTLYQWQYVQGTVVGGSGAHVAILFDREGTMIRVTHRSQTSP